MAGEQTDNPPPERPRTQESQNTSTRKPVGSQASRAPSIGKPLQSLAALGTQAQQLSSLTFAPVPDQEEPADSGFDINMPGMDDGGLFGPWLDKYLADNKIEDIFSQEPQEQQPPSPDGDGDDLYGATPRYGATPE